MVIEQIVNPLSLSLRLFGNIFAGGIMLAVIALLPFYLFPLYGVGDFVWRIFDSGLIAPIQAFIFSFLTILYFGFGNGRGALTRPITTRSQLRRNSGGN